ncbi:hypothetical protein GDO81_004374 [Engystomops pustulosus]|uniref:Calcium uniporter protein n=1 Tax=Engystomops pustulosus TaxID=76066 RepID=A0AAV6ZZB0_ENGPU|nr:hypothetical protein GDO81_004374 [Engystomops pustulosus]
MFLDGSRVASSTGIDVLLLDDFKLSINDKIYDVRTPKRELLSHEHATTMDDVKHLVQQLHTSMHIKDFQVNREKELCSRLEQLQGQLEPHEKARLQTAQKAAKMTRIVQWGGLAYMSVQFGILARLTWWEYSWDIMEPVTYFITYSGIIGMYCYFLLTGKEYIYPEATDRQYLNFFHKTSRKTGFNYLEYNRLKDDIAQVELDLKRLRDPLQMHLPLQQIDDKDQSLQNS